MRSHQTFAVALLLWIGVACDQRSREGVSGAANAEAGAAAALAGTGAGGGDSVPTPTGNRAGANAQGDGGSGGTSAVALGGGSGGDTPRGGAGMAVAGAPPQANGGATTGGERVDAGMGSLGGGATAGAGGGAGEGGGAGAGDDISLLLFSRTTGFRHDSIPAGIAALSSLANERSWGITATEDATMFTDAGLAAYDAVIFLNTTGDVLDTEQEAAFERFIRAGKGFAGIHAASDTEFDWPWYGELVGAYFRGHPEIQVADIVVEETEHLATVGLPNPWTRTDEWYAFETNPRQNVSVLLSLDEASYAPGDHHMDGDHPIAWSHEYDGGRVFYTALGHTVESYSEPPFLAHVAGGIAWVLTP